MICHHQALASKDKPKVKPVAQTSKKPENPAAEANEENEVLDIEKDVEELHKAIEGVTFVNAHFLFLWLVSIVSQVLGTAEGYQLKAYLYLHPDHYFTTTTIFTCTHFLLRKKYI